MIFDLADETLTLSDNALFLDENTVFRLEDEEAQPIDFDDEEVINTTGILEEVKQNIYKALIYYWNDSSDLGLVAVLLDPHYKDLDFLCDDSEKQLIIQKLHDEFSKLKKQASELFTCPTLPNTELATQSHKKYLQQRQMKRQKKDKMVSDLQNLDEIFKYLSLPLALSTENPLDCKRSFSDAGNLISSKRTSLDLNLAGQMLFLKKNLKAMRVFAPEWDNNES
ncbi:5874_t:CDS:2 [Cetraspora pellucida]|uniref:5874_t:CDS:1 n=1 Tax=Cetraspora pellucida TaxID=1433469 RepID=A0ACA9LMU5_9GLOM|nr:5874_t:CDS:2 [Cetraspora pellucida]